MTHYFVYQNGSLHKIESNNIPNKYKKETTPHPFRSKSNWIPPETKNSNLKRYFQAVTTEITDHLNSHNPTDTLQPHLHKALTDLQNDATTEIKPADKGGATVILNKKDYREKIMELLQNGDFYKPLNRDLTLKIRNDTATLIDHLLLNGRIDETTHKFLTPKHPPRTALFYGLPKIHKKSHL